MERDATGKRIQVLRTIDQPVAGSSLLLSIDVRAQKLAERALLWGIEEAGLKRGVVIAMNPQTGEVLALVDMPTYDNNLFARGISGRIAEDGPLPKKYRLTEMPTDSYHARTEMNVVGSDGTVIISHGGLTGGSAYTEEMATKHNKLCLHLDLNQVDVLPASLELLDWVDETGIETLNVAGTSKSKDPKIYKKVIDLLESFLLLEGSKDLILQTLRFRNPPTDKDTERPETVEEAVDRLMSELKLKDLTKLPNSADELVNLHPTVGMWIRSNFIYPRNDKLLESCALWALEPEATLDAVEAHLARQPLVQVPASTHACEDWDVALQLAKWWMKPGRPLVLHMPAQQSLPAVAEFAAAQLTEGQTSGRSHWWMRNSEAGAISLRGWQGLPPPVEFAALLDRRQQVDG